MEPTHLFSWIHLSDIHFGHGDAANVEDQKLVLDELLTDVRQMLDSGSPRPDALFVTGDIAFSGACRSKDEYERAKRWLIEVAKATGLGADAVFVVPGNHDVQRTADSSYRTAPLLRELRAGQSLLDAILADSDGCDYLKQRQKNYLEFASGFAPACRADAEPTGSQLYWRHTLAVRGLQLRLAGLNTALLAADEKIFGPDKGHLRLGMRQLSEAFGHYTGASNEVLVLLSHHPLYGGWLADEDMATSWIHSKAHLHLSGHVHEAATARVRSGGGRDLVSIHAGAAHGERHPTNSPATHSYSFGSLVAEKGAVKVRIWPRMWSAQNAGFRLDVHNTAPDQKFAEHDLPRVRLTEAPATDSKPLSLTRGPGNVHEAARAEGVEVSIAALPEGAPHFVGRADELAALDKAWAHEGTHVVTIVAWGGTGKSTLVAEWIASMTQAKWRGATRVFGWTFYSQGARDHAPASADPFINAALSFFGDPDPEKGSVLQRSERLTKLIRRQRTLLLLDGLEPLQETEKAGGRLRDPMLTALLRELAASMNGLCIVTTRQPVCEITEFMGRTAVRIDLEQLSERDGAQLLRLCDVKGSEFERQEVSRAVKGHALTVALLGHYIVDALGGDIRRWREVPLGTAETRLGEHARHVMEAYDKWFAEGQGQAERAILRIVGLFDRPVSAVCVAALRQPPGIPRVTSALVALTETQWRLAVGHLRRTGLLAPAGESDDGSLDAHPLVRECFGAMLARESSSGFRAAHRRLYQYLRDNTPEWPDTFDGLQPLYQAIWHGCRAGQFQDALGRVFFARIRRGSKHYSTKQIGAFGADLAALAGFFEGDWRRPVEGLEVAYRGWALREVAVALRALGRLREAVEPAKLVLNANVARSDWRDASMSAFSLAELQACRGDLHDALSLAERSVEYADRSGDPVYQAIARGTCANIYHCYGQREAAWKLFNEAERMESPNGRLFSIRGRQFCELLLERGELKDVVERAKETLARAEQQHQPLDIALDHLSLGSALSLLKHHDDARTHFAQAIDGLRTSGPQEFLGSALVLRVAFLRRTGDREAANRDLDAALGLARRCELKLVECDAYLEQVRLALGANDLMTARSGFETAQSLVAACAYHRRDCEVALLEARLAIADGDRTTASAAYSRARALADAEKVRLDDEELM